jgi:phosphoribosyl 1,2-cyclic phosphodiesterase
LIPEYRIQDLMLGLLKDPLSPLNSETLRATITFEDFTIGDTIKPRPGIVVRTANLNHPNRAAGYRIEFDGRSICYLTDHEHTEDGPDDALVALTKVADLVIYDSTYTEEEYLNHVGWGHSTWRQGVKLCEIAEAKKLVVFHHDPGHDDQFMDQIAREVAEVRPGTVVAREGLVLRP